MEIADIVLATSLFISLCAVVVVAIQAPLQRRALREIADRSRVDLLTALDEMGTLGMRLDAIDRGVRRLSQRIDQIQLARGDDRSDYADALELVRAGAGTEQLIAQCGLTHGEADLLRRLNPRAGSDSHLSLCGSANEA